MLRSCRGLSYINTHVDPCGLFEKAGKQYTQYFFHDISIGIPQLGWSKATMHYPYEPIYAAGVFSRGLAA